MHIVLDWLLQTSVMPLFVGGATGAMAGLVKGCAMPAARRAAWLASSALLAHVAVVGSGLVREGAMADYGVVVLICVVIGAWVCGRAR